MTFPINSIAYEFQSMPMGNQLIHHNVHPKQSTTISLFQIIIAPASCQSMQVWISVPSYI